jgi:hypothetical protein
MNSYLPGGNNSVCEVKRLLFVSLRIEQKLDMCADELREPVGVFESRSNFRAVFLVW